MKQSSKVLSFWPKVFLLFPLQLNIIYDISGAEMSNWVMDFNHREVSTFNHRANGKIRILNKWTTDWRCWLDNKTVFKPEFAFPPASARQDWEEEPHRVGSRGVWVERKKLKGKQNKVDKISMINSSMLIKYQFKGQKDDNLISKAFQSWSKKKCRKFLKTTHSIQI